MGRAAHDHMRVSPGARPDLLARMGHDDMGAALVYQWAGDADRVIARSPSALVGEHRRKQTGDDHLSDDGAAGALPQVSWLLRCCPGAGRKRCEGS